MLIRYHLVKDTRNRKQRVRLVNIEALATDAGVKAAEEDRTVILLRSGGSVANAYDYAAETQCGLAVAVPIGDMIHVVYWGGSKNAKGRSDCGTASACCHLGYDLCHGCRTEATTAAARKALIAHAKLMAKINPGYGAGEELLPKEQRAAKRHATKTLREKLEAATIQSVRELIPVH